MPHRYDEDLFESSKMTFGEHLEELRSALLKSLVALVIGFFIGLYFAGAVVEFLQIPVRDALFEYYGDQAAERYVSQLDHSDPSLAISSDDLKKQIDAEGLIPQVAYLDPGEIMEALNKKYPEQFEGVEFPPAKASPTKGDMIRMHLWMPLADNPLTEIKTLSAQEAFFIFIKAAVVFGIVVASPAVFWFIWQFVAAGLYPHEQKYVYIYLPFSIVLFMSGAALAFFAVFEYVLDFLLGFNKMMGIAPDLRISEWMSFALMLPLGFGVSFQLPLVMLFLERIGVFTVRSYLDKWRMAVLVIFIVSMLLTPADPASMLLMAAPLTLLYFGGIALCKFLPSHRGPIAN